MSRIWKTVIVVALALIFLAGMSLAQDVKPTFTAKDRELIEAYYNHLIGTLAPGSVDRSGFAPEIEKALSAGSRVPMRFEKDLEPLPPKLESQLSAVASGYGRYKLGRHVLLVADDLTITDVLKNVALKTPSR